MTEEIVGFLKRIEAEMEGLERCYLMCQDKFSEGFRLEITNYFKRIRAMLELATREIADNGQPSWTTSKVKAAAFGSSADILNSLINHIESLNQQAQRAYSEVTGKEYKRLNENKG